MVSLGQGQGGAGPPTAPVPAGGLGGSGGALWGTGLWAPCLWGREGAPLSRARQRCRVPG